VLGTSCFIACSISRTLLQDLKVCFVIYLCTSYEHIGSVSSVGCFSLPDYYSTLVGERSIAISLSVCLSLSLCVCLSMSISLKLLDRSLRNFVCRSPVAVARCFAGGIAIRYVLPALWVTSCLAVMGRMAMS